MVLARERHGTARPSRLTVAAVLCAFVPLLIGAQDKSPSVVLPPKASVGPTTADDATKHPAKQPAHTSAKSPAQPVAKPPASGPRPVGPQAVTAAETVASPPAEAEPVSSSVSGVVEDSVGNPLVGVEIYLPSGGQRTRSGAGGTFRLAGLPTGPVMIATRRIGYQATTETVHLRAGESHNMEITMAPMQVRPIVLSTQTVYASPAPMRSVFQAGFFLRKTSYPGGTFFDREYVLRMNPMYISDVFRTTTGMQAVRDRRGHTQWITRVNSTTNCPVRFFIDGNSVPVAGGTIDDLVQPSEVEGIEIYRGVSTVPAEFSGKSLQDDSRCGVVAIWTRVGR